MREEDIQIKIVYSIESLAFFVSTQLNQSKS